MSTIRSLVYLLLLKAVFMLCYTQWGPLALNPDEAQYWTWSQELDWGYYSKPPGIAWMIRLGTFLLGNTELGVRLPAVIIGFFIPLAVFYLARSCGLSQKISTWAGILTAFTPVGILGSLFATTDPGFILFWTLGCGVLAQAVASRNAPRYELLGLLIFAGALFKWPIYYLWGIAGVLAVIYPFFRTTCAFMGILISLLGLLPSLYWNLGHDFATFKHVWFTLPFTGQTGTPPSKGNPLEFIAAQVAFASPVIFILLLASLYTLFRDRKQSPPMSGVFFCGILSAAILLLHICLSVFKKMQGNWSVYAYPPAFVVLSWFLWTKLKAPKVWITFGLGTSLIFSAIVMFLFIPYKLNPFRENMGWRQLPLALEQAGYIPSQAFLFSDSYQMASLLSFYGPEQKRAYFLNLTGRRKNQFSYWPGMGEKEKGHTGFFVASVVMPRKEILDTWETRLLPYFSQVQYLMAYPLFISNGEANKYVILYQCIDYQGNEPKESFLY